MMKVLICAIRFWKSACVPKRELSWSGAGVSPIPAVGRVVADVVPHVERLAVGGDDDALVGADSFVDAVHGRG